MIWVTRSYFDERIDNIERMLELMTQGIGELDAALDAFEQASLAAEAEIQAAVNDLVKKAGPAVDVSAEIARIQAAQQKLQAAADVIKGQDTP